MLGHRLRRWPNIRKTLFQCPVLAGILLQIYLFKWWSTPRTYITCYYRNVYFTFISQPDNKMYGNVILSEFPVGLLRGYIWDPSLNTGPKKARNSDSWVVSGQPHFGLVWKLWLLLAGWNSITPIYLFTTFSTNRKYVKRSTRENCRWWTETSFWYLSGIYWDPCFDSEGSVLLTSFYQELENKKQ